MIRSVLELPVLERDPVELLGITSGGFVNADYDRFGFARVAGLVLADFEQRQPIELDEALLLAVHTADDAEPLADDLDLEFWLTDERDEQLAFQATLSLFLERWLPRLPQEPSALVLAVCNPASTELPRPPGLARNRQFYYPHGDVTAWFEDSANPIALATGTLGLSADAWRCQ